ncbi:MAG: hypothetical protein Q8L66_14645 [Caulobacter sp.]|nr:hypothetical protein [Caulobacter sp.]
MSLLVLVLAAAGAVAGPAADPLAPARAGWLQCHTPDRSRKTCLALAGYRFAADGAILNEAQVLLSPDPLVTLTTVSPVVVRDGAVCGPFEGLDTASVAVRGQPADAGTTAAVRQQMIAAMAAYIGKEGCTTYAPAGDGLIGHVTLGATRRPDLDQPVLWVDPAEGWVVGP